MKTILDRHNGLKFIMTILKLPAVIFIFSVSTFAQVNNCHTTPTGGLITGNVNYGTSINWANPNLSLVSDDSYARTSMKSPQISKYLRDRNFQFAVPSYAAITGVIVYIEKKLEAGAVIQDKSVRIEMNDTPVGDDKAKLGSTWPSSDAVFTYGGFGDMWGLSLTPSDVNNSTFGVLTSACVPAGGDSSNTYYAYIDNVQIDICFTVPFDSTCGLYALPVSVSGFNVNAVEDNHVRINWVTYSETNLDHFNVERSADGEHFEIERQVTGSGSSTTLHSYEAFDEVEFDKTYYYRLRSVDFDGNSMTETKTIVLQINRDMSDVTNSLRVFPNPSGTGAFHFSVDNAADELLVSVFNSHGIKIHEQQFNSKNHSAFRGTITFPHKPGAGIYRVNCSGTGSFSSGSVILQNE